MNSRSLSSSRLVWTFVAGLLFLCAPGLAFADSIDPSSYSDTLLVGESATITKTVTVTEAAPTTAKVDVFFLTDSTGSMGGAIGAVKASASTILASAAGLGDVAFGVGEYRDIGDVFTYRTNTDITTSTATAQAGINAWNAAGGGDWYEAQLFALETVAETTSWRDDSTRILVWFGDAPGHDPSAGGSTEASATAALLAEGIVVQAIDVGSCPYCLDREGQATRITDATGGGLFSGISTGDIVDAISDAIVEVFAEYSEVCVEGLGNLPGVGVSTSACHTGDFDRSVERTFDFDVTFTGLEEGDHDFEVVAKVDGGIVARESDAISVVPEPTAAVLFGLGLLVVARATRRACR